MKHRSFLKTNKSTKQTRWIHKKNIWAFVTSKVKQNVVWQACIIYKSDMIQALTMWFLNYFDDCRITLSIINWIGNDHCKHYSDDFNDKNCFGPPLRPCVLPHTRLKSKICNYLNVKKIFARNRPDIWNLSDCNGIRTHNHLVYKRTLNHFVKMDKSFSCVLRIFLYGALIVSCEVNVPYWSVLTTQPDNLNLQRSCQPFRAFN